MAELKDLTVYGSSNLIGESFTDVIHANKFKTNGGTSSQFVKGDGTLDNSEYVTSSDIPVTDVTVGGTSVVDSNGVAVVPAIPDEVEANPTVPSGTTPTNLTGLKVGSDYYNVAGGGGTVTDVTVGGTSVVSGGVAAVPAVPTPADATPLMDGTAAVGVSSDYAREDHIHPTDTSRAADNNVVHKTGDETVGGNKTFSDKAIFNGGAEIGDGEIFQFVKQNDQGVYFDAYYDSVNNEPTISIYGSNGDEKVRIGNIEEPRDSSDVATKNYVDTHGGGGGSAGTLNTTNTTALTPSASESLGGSVSLHKVSKTGTYSDLIGTPTYALGETTGGPASLTVGLPYGTIDATSTGTLMTATVNGITELRDGVTCIIVNNAVGSASGYTLNVNNLGAKPVYYFYDDTTQSETTFTVGKTGMFVYDSTKVSGGCWNMMYPFDPAFSASTYLIRTYYSTLPLATALGRYRLLFISADGTKFVPANSSTSTSATSAKTVTTEKIDPFGKIVLYNTTTTRTAGQTVNASYQYLQNRLTLGYSFNRTGAALTLTTNTPVYVKCSPQTDGSVMIDGTTPFVQALPNSEDGYVYIYLGIAATATQIELMINHPVYQYKGGKIIQYLPSDSNLVHKTGAETIAGMKTFNDDVNIVDSSLVIDTNDQNKHNVYMNLDNYHDDGGDGIAVLALDDPSGEGNVIIRSVASPISLYDATNKGYVDSAIQANDANLVHKTGNEQIAGVKAFSSGVEVGSGSTLSLLTYQNSGVVMSSSEVNGEKILTFSDGQNNQVRLSEVADPVQVHDAVNKGYVDGAISAMVNNETLLNGRSGTYGLPIKSLVVCSESVNGMTWLMEPLTTTGGSGDKTPNSTPHFPIGSKIYYHPDDTAFSANTDFTSKTFYSTYNNVDARYSATNGSSLSLGSSSTSNVYLRVVASPSGSTWNVYDKGNIIVTSGNLVADNFYIYLGKTVGSTAYTFQLEDNNPLYYYDGTKLIDWATYVASLSTQQSLYKKYNISTHRVNQSYYDFSRDIGSVLSAGTYKVTLMLHVTYDNSTLQSTAYGLNVTLFFGRYGSNQRTYIAGGTYVMQLIESPTSTQNRMGSIVVYLTGFLTLGTDIQSNDFIGYSYDGPIGVDLNIDQPLFGQNIESAENKDFILIEQL